jgi:hypothetical protein
VDHDEGTSLCFKKKKKSDKRRRDDNLLAAVERKASRPKGNSTKPTPSKDHFERLLDAPCPHHEIPVKHSLKDSWLIKNYVNGTLKPRMADPPKKGEPPPTTMTVRGQASCWPLLLLGGFGVRKRWGLPLLIYRSRTCRGVDLGWKGCGKSRKRSPNKFFKTLAP